MTTVVIIGIIVLLVAAVAGLVWFLFDKDGSSAPKTTEQAAQEAVDQGTNDIFNEEFREELRNRGRLHFENIINENAMFLQQDLRLTTSQLNEYMKTEIKGVLENEFAKYEKSIADAKDQALEAIRKTQTSIEQQREVLEKQLAEEAAKERARMIENFEKNMASIINHYILDAIGNEIDLNSQLDFIFQNLEQNKQDIIEDIKNGA
jgi:uncharacterized membrane protein